MKNLTLFFIAFFFTSNLIAQDTIAGIWLTGQENTKIETYQKEGLWYGKIISSDNPKAKIGVDILRGFKQVKGEWKGKLYAIKRGKEIDAVIKPATDNLEINVTAGFFTKTLEWKRNNQ